MEAHGSEGTFVPAERMEDFVNSLSTPRRIILMVQAGGPTDATIESLTPLLEEGDIVVDGGNAQFTDTRRREAELRSEEHTSELQSRGHLVCRLLLEKKNTQK